MRQEERFSLILERLSEKGTIGVAEIAAELGVSTASVRRDLQYLEDQRLLSRTHGGAMAQNLMYELPLRYKGGRHKEDKRRIAARAVERLGEGVISLGLTGGTTTTEVARALVDHPGLTIITNALNIASELALRPNVKLVVTGGLTRPESYELVGPMAEATLQALNLDVAIVGVDGISPDGGLTTYDEVEAQTNRALIGRARRVIVVADASKVGKLAFARICPLSDIQELITDGAADPRILKAIRSQGITVTLA